LENKQTILITGAGGLLGRHALEAMHGEHELHALVHREPENRLPGVTYYFIDLAADWFADQLPARVDAVIHLAQSSRYKDFPDQAMDVYKVNVDSTARLLDYAHRAGAGRFIFASTGGLYGSGESALHESAVLLPHDRLNYHFAGKYAGETLVACYTSLMHVVTLRPFFMYGQGQRRSMLIPRLVDSVRTGLPITLQRPDGIQINPVHVSDAVAVLRACLHTLDKHVVMNVAGPEVLTLGDIVRIIARKLAVEPVLTLEDTPASHLVADISAMRTLIATELTPFECGVADVL